MADGKFLKLTQYLVRKGMKMGELKNLVEVFSKLKIVGYFLALWGVTFFFRGLADLAYYAYNYGSASFSEALAETAFYVIYDVAMLAVAIVLWVLSVKILRPKAAAVSA